MYGLRWLKYSEADDDTSDMSYFQMSQMSPQNDPLSSSMARECIGQNRHQQVCVYLMIVDEEEGTRSHAWWCDMTQATGYSEFYHGHCKITVDRVILSHLPVYRSYYFKDTFRLGLMEVCQDLTIPHRQPKCSTK